jgi:hypothetical protein
VDRQRQRLVAARELLGEERDGLLLDLRGVEVDELELVLLGQRAGDRALGREAELDDDLARGGLPVAERNHWSPGAGVLMRLVSAGAPRS